VRFTVSPADFSRADPDATDPNKLHDLHDHMGAALSLRGVSYFQ